MLRTRPDPLTAMEASGQFSLAQFFKDLGYYGLLLLSALARRVDIYDVAFVALSGVLFIITWKAVGSISGVLGVDIGNYLLTMRQVFGDDPTGLGLLRPPLIAVPLKLFTALMPLVTATRAAAVAVWLLMGFTGYRLIRALVGKDTVAGVVSLFGGLGYLLGHMFATMLVFGWVSFLGMALIPLVAMAVMRGVQDGGKRWMLLLAVTATLVLGTHQFTAVLVVLWLGLFGAGALLLRERVAVLFLAKSAVLAALLSLPLVPIYNALRAGTDSRFTSLGFQGIGGLWASLAWFYREPGIWFWLTAMGLALLGAVAIARDGERPAGRLHAWLLCSLLLVPLLLNAVSDSMGQRALYYSYLPIWALGSVAAAAGIQQFATAPALATQQGILLLGLAVGAVGTVVLTGFRSDFFVQLGNAMRFYNMVEARHIEAAWLMAANTPPDARAIAFPFGLGWWIEGAAGRDTWEVGRFGNKAQNQQSAMAERVLIGNYSISNGYLVAGDSYPDPAPGTPQVWVTLPGGERAPYLYLDDSEAAISVLEYGIAERRFSLGQMARDVEAASASGTPRLIKWFSAGGLMGSQTTDLAAGGYQWSVTYSFQDGGQPVVAFTLPVHLENVVEVTPLEEPHAFRVMHRAREHSGQTYETISVLRLEATGASLESALGNPRPRGGLSDQPVQATLRPSASQFSLSVKGRVESIRTQSGQALPLDIRLPPEPAYAEARALAQENRITHVVVDRRPFHRLDPLSISTLKRLDASPAFDLVYLQDDIAVYALDSSAFEANEALARTASVPPPLQRSELAILDASLWTGLRASSIQPGPAEGVSSAVVSAQVQMEASKWGGLIFTAPAPADWSGLEWIMASFRWQSLLGIQTLSLALEDAEGRRWAWQRQASGLVFGDNGWQRWDIRRGDATRKDNGFDFSRVVRVHISALGEATASPSVNRLEVASIGYLHPQR